MSRKNQRLPRRSFIPVPIRCQTQHSPMSPVQTMSESQASGQSNSMTKTAGGKRNVRDPLRRGMSAQQGSVAMKLLQIVV